MRKIIFSSVCAVALFGTNVYAEINYDDWTAPANIETSKVFWDNLYEKFKDDSAKKQNYQAIFDGFAASKSSDLKQVKTAYENINSDIAANAVENVNNLANSKAELEKVDGFADLIKYENDLHLVSELAEKMEELRTKINSVSDKVNKPEEGPAYQNRGLWLFVANDQAIDLLFKGVEVEKTALQAEESTENNIKTVIAQAKQIAAAKNAILKNIESAGLLNLVEKDLSLEVLMQKQPKELGELIRKANNVLLKNYFIDDSGGEKSREKLKIFIDSIKTADGEYAKQKSTYLKLVNLVDLYEKQGKIQELMKAIDAIKDDFSSDASVKQAMEDAKKAVVTVEKQAVNEALKNNLSVKTANILNSNEKIAKAMVEAKSLLANIKTPTKDIYKGGLAELKAKKTLDPNDEKIIAKVEAKIKEALNEAAAEVAEEKKVEVGFVALGALNAQINNMNKRLGEIRGLDGEIGAWLRAYGTRTKSEDAKISKSYSTQIGADKKIELNNADAIVGGLFGYDRGKSSAGKSDTYSLGLYASYIANNGFFADAVLKYAKVKHKLNDANAKNQNLFLASIEGGYRFNLSDAFYLEPSFEIITGRVGKYEAVSKDNTVSIDSFTPFVLKPQVFFGANIDDFIFRFGLGGVFNAHSAPKANIDLKDFTQNGLAGESSISLKKDNHGFASIGMAYKFSDNLRLNLGAEHTFGSKDKSYELNCTLRYTF